MPMPQSEEEETKQEGEEEERKKDERRRGAESLEEGRAKRKMEEKETKQEEKRRKVVDLDKRIKDLLGEDYGVPEHLLSERGSASSFPSSSSSSSFPSSPHSFICMPPKGASTMVLCKPVAKTEAKSKIMMPLPKKHVEPLRKERGLEVAKVLFERNQYGDPILIERCCHEPCSEHNSF